MSALAERITELTRTIVELRNHIARLEGRACLICGASKPCELKTHEYSPCTFDPSPVDAARKFMTERNALAARLDSLDCSWREPGTYHCRVDTQCLACRERHIAARLAEVERDAGRMVEEIDAITDLNHGQFLQLEYLRPIRAAAEKLYAEAEEYDFPDGLGQGAPQEHWDALADALEPKTEAIKEEIGATKSPCGECHLKPGETCDICGAKQVDAAIVCEKKS